MIFLIFVLLWKVLTFWNSEEKIQQSHLCFQFVAFPFHFADWPFPLSTYILEFFFRLNQSHKYPDVIKDDPLLLYPRSSSVCQLLFITREVHLFHLQNYRMDFNTICWRDIISGCRSKKKSLKKSLEVEIIKNTFVLHFLLWFEISVSCYRYSLCDITIHSYNFRSMLIAWRTTITV